MPRIDDDCPLCGEPWIAHDDGECPEEQTFFDPDEDEPDICRNCLVLRELHDIMERCPV